MGRLVSAFIGITDQGFGFTRVEVVDTEPGNSDSHMRLIIETSDEPGSEYTATCALDYDAKGRPDHISVVAHDTDEIGTRISASWRHDLHAFKVMKVEELDGGLLYKAPVPRKKRGTRR